MPRKVGFRFPILDSSNNVTTTSVDMGDMFVEKDAFLNSGLYAWGENTDGQLGDNSARVHRSSPVQVGSLTNWKTVDDGFTHALSIKTDGTLWGWGTNSNGQLGLSNATARSSPAQVGSLSDWSQVSCGNLSSAAIKYNYTLWTWGINTSGQLGLNDATTRSSPVQVGLLTNWKQVSTGAAFNAAVKTDGTLWAWGVNGNGQLGLNDITTRSSPVQVGTLTNWKLVSCGYYHTIAVKTDGTLWTWGINSTGGQLGLGDVTDRSSPVQVGLLNNWKQVAGSKFATAAIKIDGTLWTWGNALTYGTLGLNDRTNRSSPVQVGLLTNWKQVNCGLEHMCAVKTDGTLWAWGRNDLGQLGDNSARVNRSSPFQIGSLTNWKQVACGDSFSTSIVSDDFYTYT